MRYNEFYDDLYDDGSEKELDELNEGWKDKITTGAIIVSLGLGIFNLYKTNKLDVAKTIGKEAKVAVEKKVKQKPERIYIDNSKKQLCLKFENLPFEEAEKLYNSVEGNDNFYEYVKKECGEEAAKKLITNLMPKFNWEEIDKLTSQEKKITIEEAMKDIPITVKVEKDIKLYKSERFGNILRNNPFLDKRLHGKNNVQPSNRTSGGNIVNRDVNEIPSSEYRYFTPDVNEKDKDGYTKLMYACNQGNLGIVKKLLSAGADVNAKDKDGWTALMYACDQGNLGIVETLLSAEADVNAKDKDGWTALMLASYQGDLEMVKKLLLAGADVDAEDK